MAAFEEDFLQTITSVSWGGVKIRVTITMASSPVNTIFTVHFKVEGVLVAPTATFTTLGDTHTFDIKLSDIKKLTQASPAILEMSSKAEVIADLPSSGGFFSGKYAIEKPEFSITSAAINANGPSNPELVDVTFSVNRETGHATAVNTFGGLPWV